MDIDREACFERFLDREEMHDLCEYLAKKKVGQQFQGVSVIPICKA
jgi:hypothetical protein